MASEAKKPGFFARASRYFRDIRGEMKKVVWPSRKTALNNTGIVIVFMVIAAVTVSVLDFGMANILRLIVGTA